jgi:hypothetical protein
MPVDNKPFQEARAVGGPYTRAEKLAIEYEKILKETYTKIEEKDAEISRLRAILKLIRHTGL